MLCILLLLIFLVCPSLLSVAVGETIRGAAYNNDTSSVDDRDNARIADVIIIGAGWSGLASANRLREMGVNDIRVLEARDHIGGRSRTLEGYFVDGLPTEMGSSWIYRNKEILDMYKNKLGLSWGNSRFNFRNLVLYNESGLLSRESSSSIKEEYATGFVRYIRQNANKGSSFDSLMNSYFDSQECLPNTSRQAVHALLNPVKTDLGHIFEEADASSVAPLLIWDSPMDFTAVPNGGFTRAVEGYAKPIAESILLQSAVEKVDYSTVSQKKFVEVTTDDSNVYRARVVISTIPIGVLQHRDIEFIPDLPNEKWDAIDSIGNGGVNKCIMYWDSDEKDISWWPEGQFEMQLMTNTDNGSDDWTYIVNDQFHSKIKDHHILTAWSAGEIVEELELENDDDTLDRVISNLRKMFGESVPEPTKFLVTRWLTDPYSRGVHTFGKLGVDTERAKEEIRRPVSGNMFFSGEAVGYGSDVSAAFDSGIAVADKVLASKILDEYEDEDKHHMPEDEEPEKAVGSQDVDEDNFDNLEHENKEEQQTTERERDRLYGDRFERRPRSGARDRLYGWLAWALSNQP